MDREGRSGWDDQISYPEAYAGRLILSRIRWPRANRPYPRPRVDDILTDVRLAARRRISASVVSIAFFAAGCSVPAIGLFITTAVASAKTIPTSVRPSTHISAVIPAVNDGWVIPVSNIVPSYAMTMKGQPSLTEILSAPIVLAELPSGYATPWVMIGSNKRICRPGVPLVHTTIQKLNRMGLKQIHASAINAVEQQLVSFLNKQGIFGVWISVSPKQFQNDRSIRKPGDTTLDLIIHTTVVSAVQTIAEGGRFAGQKKHIDNPELSWIERDSPIEPVQTTREKSESLLNRRALDRYIDELDRQPGRQVSAAISPTKIPGEVALRYLVYQQKPWSAYFQLANIGTPQTNIWRETYGFTDTELTGNDDILSLNYTTAGFTRENDVNGSYSIPILNPDKLRFRTYASYDNFSSSDVGFPGNTFTGDETEVGGEFILNLFQRGHFFLDGVLGLRYKHIFVDNTLLTTTSTGDFIQPYVGLHAQRYTATSDFSADAKLISSRTSDSEVTLEDLGRPLVSRNPFLFQADMYASFYLDPLFNPSGYANGKTPLANQIAVSFQGQTSFNDRLIPEEEAIAGGLYTVRGYPEAATAGDSVAIETIEYRLHVPRLFPVNPHPPEIFGSPFRFSPQRPGGNPDWDLILKSFLDVGEVMNSQPLYYEQNSVLVGTGLGAELDFRHNLSFQVDWGIALNGIGSTADDNRVTAGSSQFNFVFTASY